MKNSQTYQKTTGFMDICLFLSFYLLWIPVNSGICFPCRLKQSGAYRPLCVVCLGTSHVDRQAKDKLIEGKTFLFSPFELVHCIHERKVFILLRAFDNKRPGPEYKKNNQNESYSEQKHFVFPLLFNTVSPLQMSF